MILREYIVKPDGHYDKTVGGLLINDPVRGLPSRGTVVHAPPGFPGTSGSRVYFQWNAMLEADDVKGKGMTVHPSLVYMVGGVHLNGYLFCRLHQRPVEDWDINIDGNQYGQGEVLSCPKSNWLRTGCDIIFEPKMAHRVEAEEFSSDPIYALKAENVLMYR